MLSPLVINKTLRKHLAPVLAAQGFDLIKARRAWMWREQVIVTLDINNVGNAVSKTHGWPMHSLQMTIGVCDNASAGALPRDEQGRPRPGIDDCRQRLSLQCTLDQGVWTARLAAPERIRTGIWWVENDGRNLEAVARDIATTYPQQAVPWLKQFDVY
ncbi:MAG: hypothetical protein ACKV2V_17200 [Blastocatellia bacterium]